MTSTIFEQEWSPKAQPSCFNLYYVMTSTMKYQLGMAIDSVILNRFYRPLRDRSLSTLTHRERLHFTKGLFTWRWGTPGRWDNPPSRDRKIKRFYMQTYNPRVLGWGFLRFLLRLQLRSLSRGVPSSHLEKDERLILGHIRIYSWKRHALCYAVFGFARNRWLNKLCGIVWETK